MNESKLKPDYKEKCIKILEAEKKMREYVFSNNPTKKKQKIDQMDYCIRYINALYEENERLKTQPKLI